MTAEIVDGKLIINPSSLTEQYALTLWVKSNAEIAVHRIIEIDDTDWDVVYD